MRVTNKGDVILCLIIQYNSMYLQMIKYNTLYNNLHNNVHFKITELVFTLVIFLFQCMVLYRKGYLYNVINNNNKNIFTVPNLIYEFYQIKV